VEAVQTRGASIDPNKEQKMTHIQKLEIIPIQRKKKKKIRDRHLYGMCLKIWYKQNLGYSDYILRFCKILFG